MQNGMPYPFGADRLKRPVRDATEKYGILTGSATNEPEIVRRVLSPK
jgi:hypothetical protein